MCDIRGKWLLCECGTSCITVDSSSIRFNGKKKIKRIEKQIKFNVLSICRILRLQLLRHETKVKCFTTAVFCFAFLIFTNGLRDCIWQVWRDFRWPPDCSEREEVIPRMYRSVRWRRGEDRREEKGRVSGKRQQGMMERYETVWKVLRKSSCLKWISSHFSWD